MEQLKNEKLTVVVSPLGAELQSIKNADGEEFLWQGDPDFWPRRSPILFPIVCGLWEDTYRIDGFEYKMGRHGFARDMEFTLVSQSEHRITYALHENAETHRVYPYKFNLAITYRLQGNRIHVIWHVENTDDNEIHFGIGGHPAFLVPGCEKGGVLKGSLLFDNKKLVERIYGNVGGCIQTERFALDTDNGVWTFTEDSFRDDAVIIDKSQLKSISLLNEEGKPHVTVSFKAPAVGLWSPYGKHAPFVCIEPWYGIHDLVGYKGDFRNKYLMNHLQPGASFMSEYVIEIGE